MSTAAVGLRAELLSRIGLGCLLAAVVGLLVSAPMAVADPVGVDIAPVESQSFTGKVVDGLPCSLASATITWGDGTSSAGASDGSTGMTGTHTYTEEGAYSGTASYTYQPSGHLCPGALSVSFQANVQDALLTAGGLSVSGTSGQAASYVVAHFSDSNAGAGAGDFSTQITWGDGSKTFGTVAAAPAGGFNVAGTHTYNAAGSYPVTVNITDIGGSTASASSAAQIAAPPPPPPPLANITSRFIVNPSHPCIFNKTVLDARASRLIPGGTRTEYDWAINGVDTYQSFSPVFDLPPGGLGWDTVSYAYVGKVTHNTPGFGPTVYNVFDEHLRASPVVLRLDVSQIAPGRGPVGDSSPETTVTFTNPDVTVRIGSPGPTLLGDGPPLWIINPGRQEGCPAITNRSFFGSKVVPGSLALARLSTHSPVVLSTAGSIKLQSGCTNRLKDCFASLVVLSSAPKRRTRAHQTLPPSLGSKTFVVPAGKTISVTVPLNARGRALAQTHHLHHITLLLGSVGAGGKIVPTIRTVGLRTVR